MPDSLPPSNQTPAAAPTTASWRVALWSLILLSTVIGTGLVICLWAMRRPDAPFEALLKLIERLLLLLLPLVTLSVGYYLGERSARRQ